MPYIAPVSALSPLARLKAGFNVALRLYDRIKVISDKQVVECRRPGLSSLRYICLHSSTRVWPVKVEIYHRHDVCEKNYTMWFPFREGLCKSWNRLRLKLNPKVNDIRTLKRYKRTA